ncbi:TRAP transporter permease [Thermococcus barophilus]|uniref:TRAP transporter, 4TM/12TM fusion protein n=1 Tax=Thermococcus barophilus TaxID=55802 RepID=A0A0S1XF47_THEBA|nr:TRAP transporter fused permease subunit [Thermococcus barophilus]ALM76442.1 TRAP transporter, 4TM/12TM fusion protein [Thermococcus barophilus]
MRKIEGKVKYGIMAYAVIASLFHLYSVFANIHSLFLRSAHLMFLLPLAFLLYPATKNSPQDRIPWYDWVLAFLAALPGLYILVDFNWVISRVWSVTPLKPIEKVLGILFIILIIEATRRAVSKVLAILAGLFVIYPLIAANLPGFLKGGSASLWELVETMYLTTEGVFSIPVGVSASFVIHFLILAAFLEITGIGDYFMKLVILIAGKKKGGPAKVAALSSSVFGMLSGSAVANVYGTGSFTIPMMKKVGFPPALAGAVEAVASSGGQIMPPIMGAGAFIMASLLGISYLTVVKAAIIPAFLYYFGVYVIIHFISERDNLGVVPDEVIPPKEEVIKKLYLLSPLVVLIYALTVKTPTYAAVIALGVTILVSFLSKDTRLSPWDFIVALSEGAKRAIVVAIACAAAGMVIGAMNLTGFGFKLVGAITSLSAGIGFVALVLVAIICVIMGMGLPTTAAYVIVAAISVPVLTQLGFLPLPSHFFVFYYAILSNITYPVALAVYAAASLANADPKEIGINAVKLGIMAFITPFLFAYNPALLLHGAATKIIISALLASLGTVLLGAGIAGYFKSRLDRPKRVLFLAAGFALLIATAVFGIL